MLGIDLETVRLFLHVLAATIWVGGQLLLAALVPVLRAAGADAPAAAARGFRRLAWPAFGVLVLTGIWNIIAEGHRDAAYRHTLALKLALVLVSGVGAYVHEQSGSKRWLAIGGAAAGLGALGALLIGVRLAQ